MITLKSIECKSSENFTKTLEVALNNGWELIATSLQEGGRGFKAMLKMEVTEQSMQEDPPPEEEDPPRGKPDKDDDDDD